MSLLFSTAPVNFYNKQRTPHDVDNKQQTRSVNVTWIRKNIRNASEYNGTQSLDAYTSKLLRLKRPKNRHQRNSTKNDDSMNITYGRDRRSLATSDVIINQHFKQQSISTGQDISLKCSAVADRPPRIVWERDGVVLAPNTDSRYILGQVMSPRGNGVIAHLNISRTRVEDGGLYSCIAYEGESKVTYSARINIYGPPYIRTLPPIKIISGETLKLRCPYYGYPISKLEWEHKGKKLVTTILPQHERYKRTFDTNPLNANKQVMAANEDGVLSINEVLSEQNGDTYTCIVYSPSGEMAKRSFEIQVVEGPQLDELRVGSGLKEGQIVQITCNIISGDPPIFFSWLKDGMKIPANLKVTERSSELFSVLIIKRVSLEHCGRYTCIATNHVGKVNQTTDLFINVAPKWVEEPTNASLLLGHRGMVDCNANGYPIPQIHWMKRDKSLGIWRPVLDLAGGGVSSFPNGSLSLEVVTLGDEGEYSCHVNNGVGDPLHKNLWISVNKPVHFESVGMNLTTKKGQPLTLTCEPLGDNPIRTKWSIDGKPVESTSSRIILSENTYSTGLKSTLNIKHVDGSDRGTYECRASNPYGVATYSVFLNVLEPPIPPSNLQVESVTSSSAKISWRNLYIRHIQYYSIQYTSHLHTPWDSAKVVNVTRLTNDNHQTVELRDLQPALEYRVRVAAGNLVDLSPYTPPVYFSTLQEAPSSSPLGVQVEQTDNPGELLVSWITPRRDSHNGPLQGYHVKAVPYVGGASGPNGTHTKIIKMASKNGKHETILSGLLKNMRYAVTVSAFNSAGNGPFSMPVYENTREGAPEETITSVQCAGAAAGALRVSWPPLVSRSNLLGYVVLYSTDDAPWSNITSPRSEAYLQGLQKYTNYSIKVAGFSNFGIGPYSYPVMCTTLQDVPGPPPVVKAVVSTPISLIVSWKIPREPNGEITHYTLYVKPVSSTDAPQSYRVEPRQDTQSTRQVMFTVPNLSQGVYEVFVRAHTAVGEGAPSARVHVELSNKVVAGVWSLGGSLWVGAGGDLSLPCSAAGLPMPRALWYHDNNIITHHPRFTRQLGGGLVIHNINQSLGGNYTCIAKNLYGSDSVSYDVIVLPTPEAPILRVTSHKNALYLQWDQPKKIAGKLQKISYNLTWKEADGSWKDSWTDQAIAVHGVQEYTLDGLKCGTKYALKMTASNSVGSSAPTHVNASTLGGVPKAPSTTEWFWSNATHIFLQLSGWENSGCDITRWEIDYKEYGGRLWRRVENPMPHSNTVWNQPNSLVVSNLSPAQWYQLRVIAENAAGTTTSHFSYATTTESGGLIGPPSDLKDMDLLVITISSTLLLLCLVIFLCIIWRKYKQGLDAYRNTLTADLKSDRSNGTAPTPQDVPSDLNRIYSTPVHLTNGNKHELCEISPYAHFALGFRTFGHVDNEGPGRLNLPSNSKARYECETSFQGRSESDESDCVSRTTTLKSAPRRACRVQYHN